MFADFGFTGLVASNPQSLSGWFDIAKHTLLPSIEDKIDSVIALFGFRLSKSLVRFRWTYDSTGGQVRAPVCSL